MMHTNDCFIQHPEINQINLHITRESSWDHRLNTYQWRCTMQSYDSSSFSHLTTKSPVSASMRNDHSTDAANSTVYLCIYLQQKCGQLCKTLVIWQRRVSSVFPMARNELINKINRVPLFYIKVDYISNLSNRKGTWNLKNTDSIYEYKSSVKFGTCVFQESLSWTIKPELIGLHWSWILMCNSSAETLYMWTSRDKMMLSMLKKIWLVGRHLARNYYRTKYKRKYIFGMLFAHIMHLYCQINISQYCHRPLFLN